MSSVSIICWFVIIVWLIDSIMLSKYMSLCCIMLGPCDHGLYPNPGMLPGIGPDGMLAPGMLAPGILVPGMLVLGMLTPGMLEPGMLVEKVGKPWFHKNGPCCGTPQ